MPGGSREEAKDPVAADLAVGKTVADTAHAHDVSPSTVFRWLKEDPAFRQRVQELRSQAISEAVGVLGTNTRLAAQTLADLLNAEQPGVRLQAARSVLEFAIKAREVTEIEDRLAELERQLIENDSRSGST